MGVLLPIERLNRTLLGSPSDVVLVAPTQANALIDHKPGVLSAVWPMARAPTVSLDLMQDLVTASQADSVLRNRFLI
jgi:hypothetical protein